MSAELSSMEKFRSRKLFISLLIFGTATALLAGGYISASIWRDVAIMVGTAYLGTQAYVDSNKNTTR